MIISRTPLRISFMGGGSDLPAFYEQEPGTVISTAINKYVYITVNKKFDRGIRASYSVTEIVDRLGDLKHELIRESLRLAGIQEGIEITSISDIPSTGTGMGSSSTYTVGLLNALHACQGRHAGAERLAEEACRIEIDVCRKPIGKQDQYIAAYGGFQCIRFDPDGKVFVDPIVCKPETKAELERRLLLLYTGITRSANPILEEQNQNTAGNAATRAALRENVADGPGDVRRAVRQWAGQLWRDAPRKLAAEEKPRFHDQQSKHRRVVRTGKEAWRDRREDPGGRRRGVPAAVRSSRASSRHYLRPVLAVADAVSL